MSRKPYNKYYTDIKIAVKQGTASDYDLKQIPSSTRHRFRNSDYSGYVGKQYSGNTTTEMDLIDAYNALKQENKMLRSLLTAWNFFKLFFSVIPKHFSFVMKKRVVAFIRYMKKDVPLDRLLDIFSLSSYKFDKWKNEVKTFCLSSAVSICLKKNPQQLTEKEITTMKELCMEKEYESMSIHSLAAYAKKHEILFVSIGTWYKYTNLLKLSRILPRSRRKKNSIGIRASAPLEILHIDVTIFRTEDGTKVYIYFIMDNFSRAILSYRAELTLSGKTTVDNINEAYKIYIEPRNKEEDSVLMCDGGSENNNNNVDELLALIPIKKIIAQKDISFSNSMIEAVNKTIKYRHLFVRKNIKTYEDLLEELPKIVSDYNNKIPHYAHGTLTPAEVLSGMKEDKEKLKQQMKEAVRKRIMENQTANCGNC